MRDIAKLEDGNREVKVNLQMDIGNEEFIIGKAVLFDSSQVTPGLLAMFFFHGIKTTTNSQIERLRMSCTNLESGTFT